MTNERIVVFTLIYLAALSGLVWVYFYALNHLVFQLVGAWQETQVGLIIQSVAGAIISLWVAQWIYNLRYGKHTVKLYFSNQTLYLRAGNTSLKVPFSALKKIVYTSTNGHVSWVRIHAKRRYYVQFGSFFKGIPYQELEGFMASLSKSLADKKEFKEKTETKKLKENHVVVTSFYYAPDVSLEADKRKRYLIIGVALSVWLGGIATLCYYVLIEGEGGGSLLHETDLGSSRYAVENNKVYFLDVGYGWFELPEADRTTFEPFTFGNEYGTEMGADRERVYAGDQVLEGIDRSSVAYLGRNYLKDRAYAYYKNQVIRGADLETFHSIAHTYNTPSFPYAADSQSVYYQSHPLPGLQQDKIRFFDQVLNHIADDSLVYYKDRLLKGLKGKQTEVKKINYQYYYASDGTTHYVNGKTFPEKVPNRYWGNEKPEPRYMRMLLSPSEHWANGHLIFADLHSIYYFDENRQTFIHAGQFDHAAELRDLDDRLMTDGKHIYFTQYQRMATRQRGGSSTFVGNQTVIYRLEGVDAKTFKKVREEKGFIIYTDGQNDYVTVLGDERYFNSALYILNGNREMITEVDREDVKIIPSKKRMLKIKTRMRIRFEKRR